MRSIIEPENIVAIAELIAPLVGATVCVCILLFAIFH